MAYEHKCCETQGQTSWKLRDCPGKTGTNGIPQYIPYSARQRKVSALSEEIQAEGGANRKPVAVT